MYYPIFRGKLNELLALRELAILDIEKRFCPVIEPVKNSFSPLIKTIEVLNANGIEPLIILNPSVGDLKNNSESIQKILSNTKNIKFTPTFIVENSIEDIERFIKNFENYAFFLKGGLDQSIIDKSQNALLTFINSDISPGRLKQLNNVILYGDFFKRQKKNADYPKESVFSELHTYYSDYSNVVGFGDYSITGEEYSESGGPAYVVTIHMSYINQEKFNELYIRHYSSKSDGTPSNPGKKFLEALELFVNDYQSQDNYVSFIETEGVRQFLSLHESSHFPGLGQVKKISILHHTETINDYLINNEN